jgi:hypothetical protein
VSFLTAAGPLLYREEARKIDATVRAFAANPIIELKNLAISAALVFLLILFLVAIFGSGVSIYVLSKYLETYVQAHPIEAGITLLAALLMIAIVILLNILREPLI